MSLTTSYPDTETSGTPFTLEEEEEEEEEKKRAGGQL